MSAYYPVFVDVKKRRCIVIGGGTQGAEKVHKLLDCDANVTVISPEVEEEIKEIARLEKISWYRRKYKSGDLEGALLVVVADTTDETINQQVALEAQERDILLNVMDVTHLCTFIAPSIVDRGAVSVAISTGGASPALARKFRQELEKSNLIEYADLAPLLSEVRMELKKIGKSVDGERWQSCLDEDLLRMVQSGALKEAKEILMNGLLDNN